MRSILTVTTPATSRDLTTLDRLKQDLGITGTGDDAKLRAILAEASAAVETYTGRRLARETVSETFRPGWLSGCAETLVLARRPVAAVASVTVDGAELAAEDYELDADAGLLYRLCSGSPSVWRIARSAIVAYSAGYILPGEANRDLPHDIEAGTLALVRGFWSQSGRDPLVKSETVEGIGRLDYWIAQNGEDDFPPDAARLLAPYRGIFV